MPTARATLSPPRGHPKCESFGFHIVSLIVTDKKKMSDRLTEAYRQTPAFILRADSIAII